MTEGKQSGGSSDVRTGIQGKDKDLVVQGGGDSGEREEKKLDDTGDAEIGTRDERIDARNWEN